MVGKVRRDIRTNKLLSWSSLRSFEGRFELSHTFLHFDLGQTERVLRARFPKAPFRGLLIRGC